MKIIRSTKIKRNVSKLSPLMIDYCVAMIEGHKFTTDSISWLIEKNDSRKSLVSLGYGYSPTQNWNEGGAIIEQENINLEAPKASIYRWTAHIGDNQFWQAGDTPLIAAMRSFVESKLGEIVEIPDCL